MAQTLFYFFDKSGPGQQSLSPQRPQSPPTFYCLAPELTTDWDGAPEAWPGLANADFFQIRIPENNLSSRAGDVAWLVDCFPNKQKAQPQYDPRPYPPPPEAQHKPHLCNPCTGGPKVQGYP